MATRRIRDRAWSDRTAAAAADGEEGLVAVEGVEEVEERVRAIEAPPLLLLRRREARGAVYLMILLRRPRPRRERSALALLKEDGAVDHGRGRA
jgi:hypothetical protein